MRFIHARITWALLLALAVGCSRVAVNSGSAPQPAAANVSLRLLADAVGAHQLVLIGEMHGTQETPQLVGDLVEYETRAGRRVVLALEITSLDQSVTDRYLNSRGAPADAAALLAGSHWRKPMHDGRDSQAMLVLVKRVRALKQAGADVSIDLFDAPGDGERNQRMADHLRAVVEREPQATVLVLTGNIHAMTSPPPWGMQDGGGKPITLPPTAGQRLNDLHPLSIDIDAAGGETWTCMNDGCEPHPMVSRGPQQESLLEYSKPSESAWNATLTLPHFTASPPAISTEAK